MPRRSIDQCRTSTISSWRRWREVRILGCHSGRESGILILQRSKRRAADGRVSSCYTYYPLSVQIPFCYMLVHGHGRLAHLFVVLYCPASSYCPPCTVITIYIPKKP